MENNEDIKIVEELLKEFKTYNDLDGIQDLRLYIKAIENLLSRLKTAERMIELMAEQFEIMKDKEEEIDCFIPREYSDIDDCVKKDSCQECIIEYFRNKAKESE